MMRLIPTILNLGRALLALALNPVGAALLAIGAIAFVVWKNWDSIVGWFKGTFAKLKTAFTTGVNQIWNSLPAWFQKVLQGIGFAIKFAVNPIGGLKSLVGGGPAPDANAGQTERARVFRNRMMHGPAMRPGNGSMLHRTSMNSTAKIELTLRAPKGMDVRPTKIASDSRKTRVDFSRGPLPLG